jgi:hypothetical protein
MSPLQAFSLDGADFAMGLRGFPGRSFPDALPGEEAFARPAIDFSFERTLLLVVVFLFDPPFLNVVLNRLSLFVDGLSPLVFWPIDTDTDNSMVRNTSPKNLRVSGNSGKSVFLEDAFKK